MVDPRHVFKLMKYFYNGSLQKEEEYQQIDSTDPIIGHIRESTISNFSTIDQLHSIVNGGTLLTIDKICNNYSRVIIRKSQKELDGAIACYTSIWEKRKINNEIFETKQKNLKKIKEMEQRNPELWNSLVSFVKDTTLSNLNIVKICIDKLIDENSDKNFRRRCEKGLEKLKNEIPPWDLV